MKWFTLPLALILASCASSIAQTEQAPTNFDSIPPDITEFMPQPAILVFSKTREWRHNKGIAGADRFFAETAGYTGMGLFTTENAAVFNSEQLARFNVVVFNNMTGDTLSPEQERAFQDWLEQGGALIALHGSGDNSHGDWHWYDKQVIGPEFIGHPAGPQFQKARVVNLATDHPVMVGIPAEFSKVDEWYSFNTAELGDAVPLLGLDEDSYSPANLRYGPVQDLRMGGGPQGHPIAWVRCPGEGRVFYSAMGHNYTSYNDANNIRLLRNAFEWVRTRDAERKGCPQF